MAARKRQIKSKRRVYYAKTRANKKHTARRSLVVLFLLLVTAGIVYGLYRGAKFTGSLFFSRNPAFELKIVDIATDGRLTVSQIREYAAVETGANIFSVDTAALRKRLVDVPLVETVIVRRKLPDTLEIKITERVALAQIRWSARGLPFLIDRAGVVLPPTRSGQVLPVIEGMKSNALRPGEKSNDAGVRYCLDLLMLSDSLGFGPIVRFGTFNLRFPEFIDVTVNTETSARFPYKDAKEKLIRLVSVLQLANEQGRRIKTVDLTPDGRNVPVTYY
ncbi:MAG: FtsQ-type POTRA domain-containing protein [Kiritimatiellales bacterium]